MNANLRTTAFTESARKVLILGAGQMQGPAILRAKEMGYATLVADANPDAPFASLADEFLKIDLKDVDALVGAAKPLAEAGSLIGVFTAGTDFSLSVASIAKACGLPGIDPEAARAASDKGVMRARLAAAGVDSPEYVVVDSPEAGRRAFASIGRAVVVKPVDSMGARGCVMACDGPQAEAAVTIALGFSRSGRAIVERFLPGPEFSIDALVVGGEIIPCGIADRHIAFSPYFVEMGHTMPTAAPPEVVQAVLDAFRSGVRALGISSGAAKGDIKYSDGKAWVGEIAARLSGGYMSGWTFPYASGVDLTGAALSIACGRQPGSLEPVRDWTSAERAFISIPGRVRSLFGAYEAERLPYVKDLFLRIGPGSDVRFPTNNVEKCGNALSQAPNRALAIAAAERAAASILVRLEPDRPETDEFLNGKEAFPPSAFDLDGNALSALGRLSAISRHDGPGGQLAIAPFPIPVAAKDWHGLGFQDAARLALRVLGARFAERGETPSPASGAFWGALARGSAQAAVYAIDTLRIRGERR
jgi:biotin carboxylase